jgi:hypothetical protein
MQNYMLPSPIAALAMYLLCFSRSERDSLRSIFGRLVTLGSLRAASGSTSFSQWLITLSECALHSTKPVSARWGARRGGWCTFSFVGCHPKSTFSPPHQAPEPAPAADNVSPLALRSRAVLRRLARFVWQHRQTAKTASETPSSARQSTPVGRLSISVRGLFF